MDEQFKSELDAELQRSLFLDLAANPALLLLNSSSNVTRTSKWMLTQYSFLPGVITEFLCRGVVKLYEWRAVKRELLRNLGEELGSRSDGTTHFAILKRCLKDDAGLDLYGDLMPAEATTQMIGRIRKAISERDAHEAAGALYALEASATPELAIVGRLINAYTVAALGKRLVSEEYTSDHAHRGRAWTLDRFLASHVVDFEIGHRELFWKAVEPYLQHNRERDLFYQGFKRVIREMEDWWLALAHPPGGD